LALLGEATDWKEAVIKNEFLFSEIKKQNKNSEKLFDKQKKRVVSRQNFHQNK
jgi:hypothetical protein